MFVAQVVPQWQEEEKVSEERRVEEEMCLQANI
jgi:hypothetical protein